MPQIGRGQLHHAFWSVYAVIYDTLNVFRPYRRMVASVAESLELPPGARVLDAGCGTGNVTAALVRAGYRVSAVDRSGGMLSRAQSKNPGVQTYPADLNSTLPFADGSFDAIVCSNVLYALDQPVQSLLEFRRVLRPGGRLILTNPRADFSMMRVLARHWRESDWVGRCRLGLALPKVALLVLCNLVLLDPQQKARFYFPESDELRLVLERIGFGEVQVQPCYADQGTLFCARKSEASRRLHPHFAAPLVEVPSR